MKKLKRKCELFYLSVTSTSEADAVIKGKWNSDTITIRPLTQAEAGPSQQSSNSAPGQFSPQPRLLGQEQALVKSAVPGTVLEALHMRNPNKSPDHWAPPSVLAKNSGKYKMSICEVFSLLSPKLFKFRIWCWVVPKCLLLSNIGRGRHLSFHWRTLRLDHSRKSQVA